MSYRKTICPICQQPISTAAGARKSHMDKHARGDISPPSTARCAREHNPGKAWPPREEAFPMTPEVADAMRKVIEKAESLGVSEILIGNPKSYAV